MVLFFAPDEMLPVMAMQFLFATWYILMGAAWQTNLSYLQVAGFMLYEELILNISLQQVITHNITWFIPSIPDVNVQITASIVAFLLLIQRKSQFTNYQLLVLVIVPILLYAVVSLAGTSNPYGVLIAFLVGTANGIRKAFLYEYVIKDLVIQWFEHE